MDLAALVQEGFGLAIGVVVPLLVAALVAALVAGWLAAKFGLTDPVAAAVLRTAAVLAVLVWGAQELATSAHRLASETWAQLTEVGRADR